MGRAGACSHETTADAHRSDRRRHSHDAAYDYLLRHNDEDPLKGVRAEILEDLSL